MSIPSIFELLPFHLAAALVKIAEAPSAGTPEETPSPPLPTEQRPTVLKTLLHHGAGIGLGTLGGYAAGHLANAAYKKSQGQNIPTSALLQAAPLIGGGLGLAYTFARAQELEELRRAVQNPDNQSGGRV